MQQVRALIARVAPTEARVLITGESGTGKELVAAAIHAASRRVKPRVRHRELRGHPTRPGRVGDVRPRARRLHRRDRAAPRPLRAGHTSGTLFLDEIGDLSAEAQAKLLRTLETGELQRHRRGDDAHGSTCASYRRPTGDWRTRSPAGDFREDLFFRLNVFPINLPPLRERLDDLPRPGDPPGRAAPPPTGRRRSPRRRSTRMAAYRWPGNVRELANLVERLSILWARSGGCRRRARRAAGPADPSPPVPPDGGTVPAPLRGAGRLRARAHQPRR